MKKKSAFLEVYHSVRNFVKPSIEPSYIKTSNANWSAIEKTWIAGITQQNPDELKAVSIFTQPKIT